jgi:hypothetical protein
MYNARLQVAMVVVTMLAFVALLALNELLFARLEFAPGINWIYLPAGLRLLCILLFGTAGAIGLLLASWLVCFFYFFPDDYLRSFVGGVLASAAPYLVYRIAQHFYGLHINLVNLSPRRLLLCVLAYALASPLLHHLWFASQGYPGNLVSGFAVMATGDLLGTLIVIYTIKLLLSALPQHAAARFK